ncbi:MAG: alpha-amylase [Anaerolineae bacterium]|nr:MAG: alpha-amylase [Anaerolineae bacterium]
MTTPDWIQDAVFYQIFPDRFANGDPANDPPNAQPWGAPPQIMGFQGGDLRGVMQRFEYLLDLGVNALYFNPIFLSSSNHRYNTYDYFRIDPKLGTLEDFRALLNLAHRHGVRVVLDGVFNHCGRGFFAFADVLENGEHSPYRDWFHIHRFPVDAFSPGKAQDYEAWWGFKSLPKFNTDTAAVREYIFSVARYWLEQGIDGWRLDVPNEIDDDGFWAQFRRVVKSVNPRAALIGEIWEIEPRWANDTHFDGLMNYPVRKALLAYLNGEIGTQRFADALDAVVRAYAPENLHAMYVPLGSHDTPRLWTLLGGDEAKIRMAFAFQFAFPGAPAVYYGDEIGLPGEGDPDCRRAFPWDESRWNQPLRAWVRRLIALRKGSVALRRGTYRRVLADDHRRCLAFVRQHPEESLLVVLNPGRRARRLCLPVHEWGWQDGQTLYDLLGDNGRTFTVHEGCIDIQAAANEVLWLR